MFIKDTLSTPFPCGQRQLPKAGHSLLLMATPGPKLNIKWICANHPGGAPVAPGSHQVSWKQGLARGTGSPADSCREQELQLRIELKIEPWPW